MQVFLTALAEADVLDGNLWWRANRDSKDVFEDEVAAALLLVSVSPNVGVRVRRREAGEVRRLYLKKTRRLMYYLVEEAAQVVLVLRVWHGNRGHPPDL